MTGSLSIQIVGPSEFMLHRSINLCVNGRQHAVFENLPIVCHIDTPKRLVSIFVNLLMNLLFNRVLWLRLAV